MIEYTFEPNKQYLYVYAMKAIMDKALLIQIVASWEIIATAKYALFFKV